MCDEGVDKCYIYEEEETVMDDGNPEDYFTGLADGAIAVQGYELPPDPATLLGITWLGFDHNYYGDESPVRLVIYYNETP